MEPESERTRTQNGYGTMIVKQQAEELVGIWRLQALVSAEGLPEALAGVWELLPQDVKQAWTAHLPDLQDGAICPC